MANHCQKYSLTSNLNIDISSVGIGALRAEKSTWKVAKLGNRPMGDIEEGGSGDFWQTEYNEI